ncbi:MAG: hypothetical protein FH751_08555 [Firmicutes bacterium]|nr:hypothetical protein [Bacillota bacterium]
MNNEITKLLNGLSKGDLTTKEVIKKIDNLSLDEKTKPVLKEKSSKIKIQIINEETNINLPAIPFWLALSLGNLGTKLGSWDLKYNNDKDDDTKKYIEVLNELDLKEVFKTLEKLEPFELVDISSNNNKEIVKISIL